MEGSVPTLSLRTLVWSRSGAGRGCPTGSRMRGSQDPWGRWHSGFNPRDLKVPRTPWPGEDSGTLGPLSRPRPDPPGFWDLCSFLLRMPCRVCPGPPECPPLTQVPPSEVRRARRLRLRFLCVYCSWDDHRVLGRSVHRGWPWKWTVGKILNESTRRQATWAVVGQGADTGLLVQRAGTVRVRGYGGFWVVFRDHQSEVFVFCFSIQIIHI